MSKRILAGLLAFALCLSLAGCSRTPAAETEQEIVLPEPPEEEKNMILGERIAARPNNVSLYYVSGDGTSFSTVTRTLVASPGESLYEEAVDTLLYSTSSPDRMTFLTPEVQVLKADYACGIVSVSLSLDALGIQNEQEYLMVLASVSNTLLSMDGVCGVNVLVGNRSRSIESLPVGVQTQPYSGITPAYAQLSAEQDYFLTSETGTITRTAVLYFPSTMGDWLVPELREITFDSSDYASALIRALRTGPLENACATTAIPESVDLLVENPLLEVTASGERVLRLNFAPTLRSYLALSGMEEWQMLGSVVLTLCSFVPDLDAVRIQIGDDLITSCTLNGAERTFSDGLIRRSDFDSLIGSTMILYRPNSRGTLDVVERAVSMTRAESPLSILYALIDEAQSDAENGAVFPAEIYYEDILGVSVENGIASVNLSANFYRQSQALDDAAERGVIYAIVNTLCELENISGVRFYIEGLSAETLSGSIYLKGVLLPNPGLVAFAPSAVPEVTASP